MLIKSYTGYIVDTDRVEFYQLVDETNGYFSFIGNLLSGRKLKFGMWLESEAKQIVDSFNIAKLNGLREFVFSKSLEECLEMNKISELLNTVEEVRSRASANLDKNRFNISAQESLRKLEE